MTVYDGIEAYEAMRTMRVSEGYVRVSTGYEGSKSSLFICLQFCSGEAAKHLAMGTETGICLASTSVSAFSSAVFIIFLLFAHDTRMIYYVTCMNIFTSQ